MNFFSFSVPALQNRMLPFYHIITFPYMTTTRPRRVFIINELFKQFEAKLSIESAYIKRVSPEGNGNIFIQLY